MDGSAFRVSRGEKAVLWLVLAGLVAAIFTAGFFLGRASMYWPTPRLEWTP